LADIVGGSPSLSVRAREWLNRISWCCGLRFWAWSFRWAIASWLDVGSLHGGAATFERSRGEVGSPRERGIFAGVVALRNSDYAFCSRLGPIRARLPECTREYGDAERTRRLRVVRAGCVAPLDCRGGRGHHDR